ncbi:hypothetical protein [Massilia cavernae]|uniref:Uncharacterized protein n=1 Tax=Massilia cavernae TaxID=2320864 RepID=A0A418Y145_9BURK|nr:hypothetical protein [Massilia cavernae]RJG19194.1 hypothetical protein D3872_08815 [Massilia cavernae]
MKGRIDIAWQAWAERRKAWRRGRNFDAARRKPVAPPRLRLPVPGPAAWVGVAGILAALGGAVLIAGHACKLAEDAGSGIGSAASVFQPAVPGAAFTVSDAPGVSLLKQAHGTVLVAAGMKAAPAAAVDLCRQALRPGARMLPLRVGYQFKDVARWAARNEARPGTVAIRNVLLAAPASGDVPRVTVTGDPGADALQLAWEGGTAARWISDASGGAVRDQGRGMLKREGWLVWNEGALRIQRRASGSCGSGELLLQVLRPGQAAARAAQVHAFGAVGAQAPARADAPGATTSPCGARSDARETYPCSSPRGGAPWVRLGARSGW